MKKLHPLLFLYFFAFSLVSCKKDGKNCVQVQFIMDYCPKTGAALVEVLEPSDDATASTNNGYTTYKMALLNLPEEFRVRDKVFLVKYYYDAESAKPDTTFCPAIFGPVNVLVVRSVSLTGCDI
jgi:hypothetical protein